jgi:hypothetical protein
MVRASIAVLAAACTAISSAALAQTTPNPSQPNQTVAGPPPMRFEWMREGPAEKCGTQCREWISATGAIVDTTVMDFEAFAQTRDVRGATVALDSPGGSVVQGLALGREFRRLEIVTTVGQSVRIGAESDQRATLSPNATCNSMCVYVLLGGVQRNVPEEARVLVHQIWPASKRNDANAATYSAANVVAIQRVSGELGRYIVDMGADIELFEISSRIPPWEEMRSLTREELRRLRIHTIDDPFGKPPMVRAAAPPGKKADFAMVSLNPLGWTIVERRGLRALVRQHPITIEGQEIGAFEIAFSCSDKPDIFRVSYAEKRFAQNTAGGFVDRVEAVGISVRQENSYFRTLLTMEDSVPTKGAMELISRARGTIAASLLETAVATAAAEGMASASQQGMIVATTTTGKVRTVIRIGQTGLAEGLRVLTTSCSDQLPH